MNIYTCIYRIRILTDEHCEERVQIPGLAGNDARHHVGLDGRVLERGAVAEPDADPHKRERDEEPNAEHREHGADGDGTRGALRERSEYVSSGVEIHRGLRG